MNEFPLHNRVSLKKVGFCTVTLKNKIATIGITTGIHISAACQWYSQVYLRGYGPTDKTTVGIK